ncbi:hypothetical protein ACTWP6_09735 [Mycobacterium sp. 4D054]|uniref:hypothetical protein n=1 Tax=unclassified Mycobacterium TaxID=2642494 RepID=UPI0021B278D3|nr:hypothetical protein [Mycobacterium sp. SMC-8]UXA12456.1 hypothetical protein KXD97_00690 [Mycobacterium sp. SMC-8]
MAGNNRRRRVERNPPANSTTRRRFVANGKWIARVFAGRLDRLSHSSGVDPLLPALRQRFQTALNTALVVGRPPECAIDLGPRTLAAVALIAAEHPDASAQIIAAAYDTFLDEHG